MRAAFRLVLISLDETGLALVRLAPTGVYEPVGLNLSLGAWHARDHLAQIQRPARR